MNRVGVEPRRSIDEGFVRRGLRDAREFISGAVVAITIAAFSLALWAIFGSFPGWVDGIIALGLYLSLLVVYLIRAPFAQRNEARREVAQFREGPARWADLDAHINTGERGFASSMDLVLWNQGTDNAKNISLDLERSESEQGKCDKILFPERYRTFPSIEARQLVKVPLHEEGLEKCRCRVVSLRLAWEDARGTHTKTLSLLTRPSPW